MPPKSCSELLELYPDEAWRNRYIELSNLRAFFANCILGRNHTVPDSLNAAIQLTQAGRDVVKTLTAKHKLNPKDARMRTFLKFGHHELLVDIEKTQPEKLRESLQSQLLSRKVLFANSYGRELYDRAADMFDTQQSSLSYDETFDLICNTETGFYQLGSWSVGPLGVQESAESRWYEPRREFPLFHCSKVTCHTVHTSILISDLKAAVNDCIPTFDAALKENYPPASQWDEFEKKILRSETNALSDTSTGALHWLLGDGFDTVELRQIATLLLDKFTDGDLRRRAARIGMRGSADEVLTGLSHWQILHLILLANDLQIIAAIENWVKKPEGHLAGGEVRRPVINSGYGYGQFGLYGELNQYGVRFVSDMPGLPHLRLHRLIEQIYDKSVTEDINEFDWQFREADSPTRDGKQEQFIREIEPYSVVQRVVLGRRTGMIAACEQLGINSESYLDDHSFINEVLWKLGYEPRLPGDTNKEFWEVHTRLTSVAQTSVATAAVDEADIRSISSQYFVELERVLDDSLAFSTWVLTHDQLSIAVPFTYESETSRDIALTKLSVFSREQDGREVHDFARPTLYSLLRGFEILSSYLVDRIANHTESERDTQDLPVDRYGSNLRMFPFLHREAFLDLTSDAKLNPLSRS